MYYIHVDRTERVRFIRIGRSFLFMYNIDKVIGTGRQLTGTSMQVRSILCQFDSI